MLLTKYIIHRWCCERTKLTSTARYVLSFLSFANCYSFSQELVGQTLQFGIQLALTDYQVLSSYGQRCSLIEVQTSTGFKHQVRHTHILPHVYRYII